MSTEIELSVDEFELLHSAALAPVLGDNPSVRHRCFNLEARALLQRLKGPERRLSLRRPTFVLTRWGWRRLREAVPRTSGRDPRARRGAEKGRHGSGDASAYLSLIIDQGTWTETAKP